MYLCVSERNARHNAYLLSFSAAAKSGEITFPSMGLHDCAYVGCLRMHSIGARVSEQAISLKAIRALHPRGAMYKLSDTPQRGCDRGRSAHNEIDTVMETERKSSRAEAFPK